MPNNINWGDSLSLPPHTHSPLFVFLYLMSKERDFGGRQPTDKTWPADHFFPAVGYAEQFKFLDTLSSREK